MLIDGVVCCVSLHHVYEQIGDSSNVVTSPGGPQLSPETGTRAAVLLQSPHKLAPSFCTLLGKSCRWIQDMLTGAPALKMIAHRGVGVPSVIALWCLCLWKWAYKELTAHNGLCRMYIIQTQQIVLLEPLTPSLLNYAPLPSLNYSF